MDGILRVYVHMSMYTVLMLIQRMDMYELYILILFTEYLNLGTQHSQAFIWFEVSDFRCCVGIPGVKVQCKC